MLSVLVATCPCALSLATPTAMTCAISSFAKKGILLTNSNCLVALTKINHIVIDKTGTLTTGKIKIAESQFYTDEQPEKIMAMVLALEAHSNHPIAAAFCHQKTTKSDKVTFNFQEINNVIGHGIQAFYLDKFSENRQQWRIGNPKFALQENLATTNYNNQHQIILSCNKEIIASFMVTDPIKPESKKFITDAFKKKLKVTMLTGDHSDAVLQVAKKLNIADIVSNASPSDKLTFINHKTKQDICLMIGDGVNDAPTLSGAHVSVSFAEGSDIAKSSADIILLNSDLNKVFEAQKIATRTYRIIKQNLFWALFYNITVLPLAVAGIVTPYIAVLGMSLSSLIVIANSLRILKTNR